MRPETSTPHFASSHTPSDSTGVVNSACFRLHVAHPPDDWRERQDVGLHGDGRVGAHRRGPLLVGVGLPRLLICETGPEPTVRRQSSRPRACRSTFRCAAELGIRAWESRWIHDRGTSSVVHAFTPWGTLAHSVLRTGVTQRRSWCSPEAKQQPAARIDGIGWELGWPALPTRHPGPELLDDVARGASRDAIADRAPGVRRAEHDPRRDRHVAPTEAGSGRERDEKGSTTSIAGARTSAAGSPPQVGPASQRWLPSGRAPALFSGTHRWDGRKGAPRTEGPTTDCTSSLRTRAGGDGRPDCTRRRTTPRTHRCTTQQRRRPTGEGPVEGDPLGDGRALHRVGGIWIRLWITGRVGVARSSVGVRLSHASARIRIWMPFAVLYPSAIIFTAHTHRCSAPRPPKPSLQCSTHSHSVQHSARAS